MAEGPQVLRSCSPRRSPRPFCSQEKQSFPSLGCYEGFPLERGSEGYVPGEGVGLWGPSASAVVGFGLLVSLRWATRVGEGRMPGNLRVLMLWDLCLQRAASRGSIGAPWNGASRRADVTSTRSLAPSRAGTGPTALPPRPVPSVTL